MIGPQLPRTLFNSLSFRPRTTLRVMYRRTRISFESCRAPRGEKTAFPKELPPHRAARAGGRQQIRIISQASSQPVAASRPPSSHGPAAAPLGARVRCCVDVHYIDSNTVVDTQKIRFLLLGRSCSPYQVSSGTVRAIADKTENVTSSERDSRSEICAKDPRKTYRIDEYGING